MRAAGNRPSPARALALAALAVLAAAGCSRPDWTNPETSKGSRALPVRKAKARPADPGGTPPPPAWVTPLLGQALRTAFPRDGVCVGNTDAVSTVFQGDPKGARLVGWAWEYGTKAPVPRVVLVDAQERIIGGGDSGSPRTDVPKVLPAVTSDRTGWQATAAIASGAVRAYGVVENGQAVCPLAGAVL
jgi:hypothetical protein